MTTNILQRSGYEWKNKKAVVESFSAETLLFTTDRKKQGSLEVYGSSWTPRNPPWFFDGVLIVDKNSSPKEILDTINSFNGIKEVFFWRELS